MQKTVALIVVITIGAIIVGAAVVFSNEDVGNSDLNEVNSDNQDIISQQANLTVEDVRFFFDEEQKIEITLQNSGASSTRINDVYVGTSSTMIAQPNVSYIPSEVVPEEDIISIIIQYDWTAGTTYYFRIDTEEGLELQFSEDS